MPTRAYRPIGRDLLIGARTELSYSPPECRFQLQARCCATDAIILDLQMPEMDGLTALPRLRQLCPDAVIAAHSFDGEALERAVALGADLSVAKGSGLDELLDAIVAGRETRRQLHSSEKSSAA